MIIDTLSIAGLLATVFYLLSFLWFGRDTLKVEDDPATTEPLTGPAARCPCTDV